MIDKHAPQIVTTGGEPSSEMIEPCSVNASTDRMNDQGPLKETAASMSGMAAVRFPLPPSHSDDPETAENRPPDRESNRASGQSPATRSTSSQIAEHSQENDPEKAEPRVWVTEVGRNLRLFLRDRRGRPEQRDLVIQPRHFVADEGDRQSAGGEEAVVEFPQRKPLSQLLRAVGQQRVHL